MGRLIDTDDLLKQMGEPKDYAEELIRNVIVDFIDSTPSAEPSEAQTSEWKWSTYTNGFGSFKALMCAKCSTKRAQEELSYCAHCGRRMVNAEEVGGTDVKKNADRLFHELMGGIT